MGIGRALRRVGLVTLAGGSVLALVVGVGCVRTSGETWYFKSAEFPEGWPELTPVDEVRVQEYPLYRAAAVSEVEVEGRMEPMFGELFRHISDRDIAMTAPVEMEYGDGGGMESMAFLYRRPDMGEVGRAGGVEVLDVPARWYASVGVRGSYTRENYERGVGRLEDWLAGQSDWRVDGSARYLGYNGPFVPWFWRYGEVQVPVVRAGSGG